VIEVELTHREWAKAAMHGCDRQIDGLIRGRVSTQTGSHLQPTDGWFWNVNGASGEACVAKWLGVPWDGCFGDLKASDVADLEVRTRPKHDYDLLVFDHDKDDRVYILVTGTGPRWRINGFILGRKGKNPEWMHAEPGGKPNGRAPAYWVPQSALNHDLELLKRRFLARYEAAAEQPPT
jgi:hypothetical protein